MKICGVCKEKKPFSEYYPHARKGYQSSCKACRSAYNRQHFQDNRERYYASRKRQRERTVKWYRDLKANPCLDCGQTFDHWKMTYDHLPGHEKIASIANMVRLCNRQKTLDEIAKCELVCLHCHADRTERRRHEGDAD